MTALAAPPTAPEKDGPPQPPPGKRLRKGGAGRTMKGGWLSYLILGFALLLSAFPFYWTIVTASRSNADMAKVPPSLLPGPNLIKNFEQVLEEADIGKALLNSLIVSSSITIGTVLCCTLAGFAFAKLKFKGRNALLTLTIGTMMIPPQLGVIPLFMLIAELQWVNQLQAVILPGLVSAFGVFFMRQYLVQSLPDELIEAARVDGASTARIFWSIVIPIARPGMAVLGMLTFMTAWNDFFWPIIALSSQEPTVQVALRQLGGGYVNDQSVIMAGTLLGTLPVLLVFGLLGRQIVGGIMQGAVKG
ncbi:MULTISPECIES: carbohydrate ABC transporter permease [Streptomyces]|uniref:Carbohydrate ABC transporter permease n=5 Tax=Streptomyces TaxID=1883 RepID=A0AAD0VFP6_9ACTN|nr:MULTISPECIES: carbohydrate ABC transporter permease [Streptomyces]NUW24083.1 carbohydrate ABC transporter permease [Streptomyces roseoviolaceus]POG44820.1 sugar ABC transporter permease [Streptomyces sp. ZL-24]ALC28394.1 sugar ABC transporter permease [Streptomyces sp. CFMR 7]ATY97271.1 carbohydrate ABC transporter permease [Streptomyces cavourensis]AXI73101.1 carbohydrate ABC transporter permease [Streptomyces cavourensis]